MQQNLRKLIQEVILEQETEQEIDEFSTTASVAGAITPLGTDAKYPNSKKKKKKQISEKESISQKI